MAIQERDRLSQRDELIAQILREYPPVRRLEEIMGPEPTEDEAGEVDAFLEIRAAWRQPYSRAEFEP